MLTEFIEIGRFMIEAYKHVWPYLLITVPLAIGRLGGTFVMSLLGGYIIFFLTKVNWLDQDVMKNRSSKKLIPSFKFKILQSPSPILVTPLSGFLSI